MKKIIINLLVEIISVDLKGDARLLDEIFKIAPRIQD